MYIRTKLTRSVRDTLRDTPRPTKYNITYNNVILALAATILQIAIINIVAWQTNTSNTKASRHCERGGKRKKGYYLPSIGNKLSVIGYDQIENGNGNNV